MKPTRTRLTARPSLKDSLLDFERTLIHTALVASEWNQRRAAEALDVLPTTLSEKIQRLGIVSPKPHAGRTLKSRVGVLLPSRSSVPAIEISAPVNGWCRACGQDAREA